MISAVIVIFNKSRVIQLACLNKWQAGIKDESVLVDTEFGISND
jgi:hypothetical protein